MRRWLLTAGRLVAARFWRAGGDDCAVQLWEVAPGLEESEHDAREYLEAFDSRRCAAVAVGFEGAMVEAEEVGLQAVVEQQQIHNLPAPHHGPRQPIQEAFCSLSVVRLLRQAPQGPLDEQVRGIASQRAEIRSISLRGQLRFCEGEVDLPVDEDAAEVRFTIRQETLFKFPGLAVLRQVLLSYAGLGSGEFASAFVLPRP